MSRVSPLRSQSRMGVFHGSSSRREVLGLLLMGCIRGLAENIGPSGLNSESDSGSKEQGRPRRLDSASARRVVETWLLSQTKRSAWEARVIQIRHLPALTAPLSAPGRLWFQAPDRFRWELGDPVQSVAISNGSTLLILTPELKRAELLDLAAQDGSPGRDLLALLNSGFPKNSAEFQRRFDVLSVESIADQYQLQLRPRSIQARRWLTALTLEVGSENWDLIGTELHFRDGTRLRNEFYERRIKETLDPALFSVEVPEDYAVPSSGGPPARRQKS